MQYRKKPVVIDATQWMKHGDHPNVKELPVAHPLWDNADAPYQFGWIDTLEGGHIVSKGDYIITGVRGEQYPCKPEIFLATYDPA